MNYISLISEHELQDGTLSEEELINIQGRLWALLGNRTQRFTMGDSSSVPIETANELFKSICFTIRMYLMASEDKISLLKNEKIEVLLKAGWTKIKEAVEIGRELLKKAETTAPPIDNISLNDTLQEIKVFFKKYDYEYFAHEIPCDIDYQLCYAVSDKLQGIEYINEYLRRLIIENELCRRFETERIIMLLKSYCQDYKGLLINIFEPVITNAIGLVLVEGNIASLDIIDSDRSKLLYLFKTWSKEEAIKELNQASERLCSYLKITGSAEKEYLRDFAVDLYPRIAAVLTTNNLEGIFLSLSKTEEPEVSSVKFIDGKIMDDKKLRMLINEIRSCRYTSDKIAMFKQQVHSLSDCIEVLNCCFWDDESFSLYDALDKTELAVLINFISEKKKEMSDWCSESGWEKQLVKFIQEKSSFDR